MVDGKEKYAPRIATGLNSVATVSLPLLRQLMHKKGMVMADIVAMWKQIVGDEIAQYTFPEKIDFPRGERCKGVLRMKVPSGAFAVELKHREKYLIERINTFFGYEAIKEIKIIQDVGIFKMVKIESNQPMVQKTLVSKEEQNYITQVTGEITNVKLREKLRKLGEAVFSRNHE